MCVFTSIQQTHTVQVNAISSVAIMLCLQSIVCSAFSLQPQTNQQTHAAELMTQSHKVSYTCEVVDHGRVETYCAEWGGRESCEIAQYCFHLNLFMNYNVENIGNLAMKMQYSLILTLCNNGMFYEVICVENKA